MKKSRDIIGLPVISIADGKEMGSVKSLVINPDQGSVEFMVVSSDEWQLGIKAIPFKLIVGMGEFAVTIESSSSIIDLAEIPIANELLSKNIQIHSTRIITRKGRLLGKAEEYFLDEETGKIAAVSFLMEKDNEQKLLPEDVVLTFGREIIVVSEDVDDHIIGSINDLENLEDTQSEEQGNADTTVAETETPLQSVRENAAASEATGSATVSDLEEDFDMRQFPLLVGKKVTADITDSQGNIIIAQGEAVTEEVFNKIRSYGRSKLIELTLKVED